MIYNGLNQFRAYGVFVFFGQGRSYTTLAGLMYFFGGARYTTAIAEVSHVCIYVTLTTPSRSPQDYMGALFETQKLERICAAE